MKTLKNLIGIASLAFLFVGCGDEFLVEEPTGTADGNALVNADMLSAAIELNPELSTGGLTGIYSTMIQTGTGGTTSQDDFGQKGYDIFSDMLSGDVALSVSTYGWYRAGITEFQAPQDFTQLENYQVWRYYYRIINLANLVIQNLGGNEFEPESQDIRHSYGQALAMRAHSYFYLTQFMINDVEASWTQPTLPIYTTPGFAGNPKSTTEEVYSLMENDLTRAIDYLDGYSRPSKTYVNKPVAQVILAYVLGSRRDRWEDVAAIAGEAMAGTTASFLVGQDNPTTTQTDERQAVGGILGGFNDVSSRSWMWGIDLNPDIGLGLVSWWGQMDYYSYSYAAVGDSKAMDINLYNSMSADDSRRDQFYVAGSGDQFLQPLYKFYDSDRVFFGSSQVVKADYVYMRYEEAVLLRAEGLAKSGQEAAARDVLYELVSRRVEDPSYVNTLSGQVLIDEIYRQTRLEFWGEGKSYLALKRNEGTVTRGSNHLSFVGEPISFDDERLTFEIPQQELQDNNFISEQN